MSDQSKREQPKRPKPKRSKTIASDTTSAAPAAAPTASISHQQDVLNDALQTGPQDSGSSEQAGARRVGFMPYDDPRARIASAMHDALGERKPSDLTVSELAAIAEDVGMFVEGSGDGGRLLHADYVREVQRLARAYPRRRPVA